MALSIAPPPRGRFGGLRRMFRSAHRKGSVSAASADGQLRDDADQALQVTEATEEACEDHVQKPAPAVQLQIHAAADVTTPAAAQWQFRDNSIYSPADDSEAVQPPAAVLPAEAAANDVPVSRSTPGSPLVQVHWPSSSAAASASCKPGAAAAPAAGAVAPMVDNPIFCSSPSAGFRASALAASSGAMAAKRNATAGHMTQPHDDADSIRLPGSPCESVSSFDGGGGGDYHSNDNVSDGSDRRSEGGSVFSGSDDESDSETENYASASLPASSAASSSMPGSLVAGARQSSTGGPTTLQQLPPFEQLVRLPRSADGRAAQRAELHTVAASASGVPAARPEASAVGLAAAEGSVNTSQRAAQPGPAQAAQQERSPLTAALAQAAHRISPLSAAFARAELRVAGLAADDTGKQPASKPPSPGPVPQLNEALEAADALLSDGCAADAALHIGVLHAVAQHGDAATQATLRGALAADLAPLVVQLSAVICSNEAAPVRQQAAMVLRWLAAGVAALLDSEDVACRGAARDAARSLIQADLDAARRSMRASANAEPPCPGSSKHDGSPWQLVADSASQRQGSSLSLDTSSLMGSMMDEQSMEELRMSLSRRHLPRARAAITPEGSAAGNSQRRGAPLQAVLALFAARQRDGWAAGAYLLNAIMALGEEEVAAAGGASLLKPLVLTMHKGDLDSKTEAAIALGRACAVPEVAAALAQKPRWLNVLMRVMGMPSPAAEAAAAAAFATIATTEATNLAGRPRAQILRPAESIPALPAALAAVLGDHDSSPEARASTAAALKCLVAAAPAVRDALAVDKVVAAQISAGLTCQAAAYDAARVLQFLTVTENANGQAVYAKAAQPLAALLHGASPQLRAVAASTLAVLLQGRPAAAHAVAPAAGAAVRGLLADAVPGALGTGRGGKAGAELLLALLTEAPDSLQRQDLTEAAAPLVALLRTGGLPQRGAAAAAVQALAARPGGAVRVASAGGAVPLVRMASQAPLPLRCAAAGALCNLLAACPAALQVDARSIAVPLVALLAPSAPYNGQYCAAAALANMAAVGPNARKAILAAAGLPAAVSMLGSDSWYCRTAAADLLARLATDAAGRKALKAHAQHAGAALLATLRLPHKSEALAALGTIESFLVHCQRRSDQIRLEGYKLARTKTAAALALGVLLAAHPGAVSPADLQEGAVLETLELLAAGGAAAARAGAALAADLAAADAGVAQALAAAGAQHRLAALLRAADEEGPAAGRGVATAAMRALAALRCASPGSAAPAPLPPGVDAAARRFTKSAIPGQAAAAAALLNPAADVNDKPAVDGRPAGDSKAGRRGRDRGGRAGDSTEGGGGSVCAAVVAGDCAGGRGRHVVTATPATHLLTLTQVPLDELLASPPTAASLRPSAFPIDTTAVVPPPLALPMSAPAPAKAGLRERFSAAELGAAAAATKARAAVPRMSFGALASPASCSYATPSPRAAGIAAPSPRDFATPRGMTPRGTTPQGSMPRVRRA